ncbi:MAG TPA: bifunctional 4-hydroxy-2-oxoglutarate aldolase/2-dehydro-3-deoxy-phosphogluconate aldolase [Lacunisphaera sp.]|nr:bifunctional 4-hydroxy-2-oxoglutarate aldolase/2-dehydro-3-deoxy-phosphogluconate aldolase [Lacunisphaera sp.]
MFPPILIESLTRAGVVAVLTIENADDAVPVARALAEGGVSAIELTFRTPTAAESLRRIRTELPDLVVGAGTILDRLQLETAGRAGAVFAVAPGCNPSTLRAAQAAGLPFAPGVATPTDIEVAVEHGCRLVKYFPAETAGGLKHLAVMHAPFAHLGLRYIPLGGVGPETLADYLRSPLIAAVGGSWLARPEVIRRRDWAEITRAAAAAMAVVRAVREGAGGG